MFRFVLKRLALAVATLWVLSIVTFLLGALAPSGPVEIILGKRADPQAIAELTHQYGLDRPLPEQYARWLGAALRGDFGTSFRNRQPVGRTLVERYPVTLRLALLAAVLAIGIGGTLGLLAALRAGTWIDRAATTLALTGVSVPVFVALPLLVYFFALQWRLVPVTYERQDWHLLLPALALAGRPAALIARMTRSSFVEALGQDYVRTARAKGLDWVTTVVRHAGRNAALPVLTVLGTSVGYLLGGSFVAETLYGVPGIGEMSVASIPARDFPVIQAVTLLGAVAFILVNLVVDLLYGYLDPRLRVAVPASPASAAAPTPP